MPWCDDCDRFLNPNTVRDDGTCPSCGTRLVNQRQLRRSRKGKGASADALAVRAARAPSTNGDGSTPEIGSGNDEPDLDAIGTPWHFKVLLVALVIYLAWRAFEGIAWVVARF